MINYEELLKEFTKEQLTIPYDKLPENLANNARYKLARLHYDDINGTKPKKRISYREYLKFKKDKNIGFCDYILQHGL